MDRVKSLASFSDDFDPPAFIDLLISFLNSIEMNTNEPMLGPVVLEIVRY